MLLAHYILKSLSDRKDLPKNSTVIKTTVTTEGVRKIVESEETNSNSFIFGLEESYGYLLWNFVRDKDTVIAAMLITEMALYYKENGLTLYEALVKLYEEYGFTQEELISIERQRKEGQEKIN